MIIDAYQLTKKAMFQLRLCKNMYKNITPLSVVRLIYNELQQLKEENNLLLISEFNTIVSEQIKDQPSPIIYERVGERFAHFFIDEFQDTSKLQWQNLRPLLSNALAYDTGSLMLVGDAKQAIYRWRGGQAEQLISLINNDADFQPKPKVLNLPTNYRSSRAVVDFNNQFFQHLSTTVFSDQVHSQLYTNSKQDTADENHGFVQATFLEFENGEDKAQRYANHVLEIQQIKKISNFILSNKFEYVLVLNDVDEINDFDLNQVLDEIDEEGIGKVFLNESVEDPST